jgi:hypothetical protein
MRRAARCRVTMEPQHAVSTPRGDLFGSESSQRRIARRRVPSFCLSQKTLRTALCSTAPVAIVPFALQAWSETGTRFALCASPRPLRRTRNDSRSRSRNRSRSQHPRNACSLSSSMSCLECAGVTCYRTPNRSRDVIAQTFSSGLTIGAIGPDGIVSGGTTSGMGPVETWGTWGCSMRVAMSIAVKSSAPARK